VIKSLHIQNFQSHKNTKLNLHSGVNVIIGESDTGKSAILRALSWLVRNKVDDKSFRSNWGGKTDVEIRFDDGNEVSRTQDKDNCYYLVNEETGVDEEYKAFRTDIPQDIVEVLNMDVLNMSYQFDPPFLLSDSSGEVAKTLNKIADLTDIDTSISNIRKMVLSNNREITGVEFQLEELTKQKEALSFLSDMEKDVDRFEELSDKNSALDFKIDWLTKILEDISKTKDEMKKIDSFLAVFDDTTLALVLVDKEKSLRETARRLESHIKTIETDTKELKDVNSFLLAEKEALLIGNMVSQLDGLEKKSSKLKSMADLIDGQNVKLVNSDCSIKLKSEYLQSVMPEVCPLCNQEIHL
jgi:exonuclease SbcC